MIDVEIEGRVKGHFLSLSDTPYVKLAISNQAFYTVRHEVINIMWAAGASIEAEGVLKFILLTGTCY